MIVILHGLGLNRPVSASLDSLFNGLPSRRLPVGLQFSVMDFIISFCFQLRDLCI